MQTKKLADANIFASRLKSLQKERNIPNTSIRDACGVSMPTISQWRSARHMPERQHWDKLASLLGVSIEDLFFSRTEVGLHELNEPPPQGFNKDRMLRPLTGPPDDSDPHSLTRDDLEAELSYYLDRAERAGAISVAAYHIRRYLDPSQFDFVNKPMSKGD